MRFKHMLNRIGFSIVREYVGHGIGQDLHEDPQIPHYGPPNKGPQFKTRHGALR